MRAASTFMATDIGFFPLKEREGGAMFVGLRFERYGFQRDPIS